MRGSGCEMRNSMLIWLNENVNLIPGLTLTFILAVGFVVSQARLSEGVRDLSLHCTLPVQLLERGVVKR